MHPRNWTSELIRDHVTGILWEPDWGRFGILFVTVRDNFVSDRTDNGDVPQCVTCTGTTVYVCMMMT